MFTLAIENHLGEKIQLSGNPDYSITSVTGISPPYAYVNLSENANSDGGTFNSSKMTSRNIVIELAMEGDAEASRINLYRYVKVKKNCVVYFKNGRRDVKIAGYVESFECNPFEQKEMAQISIICPNPYFRNVEDEEENFSEEEPLFEFPMDVPEEGVELSRIILNDQTVITNDGDVATGMVIELRAFGEVVNPSVYNAETYDTMKINKTIDNGDVIIISTVKGQKSVTYIHSGVRTNILNDLDRSSVWLELESGDNVINYTADDGEENLECSIVYSELYEGV